MEKRAHSQCALEGSQCFKHGVCLAPGNDTFGSVEYFVNKEPAAPGFVKLVQQSVFIPVSNVVVKRILSITGNLC